jgi:hypothetical protein
MLASILMAIYSMLLVHFHENCLSQFIMCSFLTGWIVHSHPSGSRCLLPIIHDIFGLSCSSSLSSLHQQSVDRKFSHRQITFASLRSTMSTGENQIWFDHRSVMNVEYVSLEKVLYRVGMAITEKQGGSDVRANTTRAYCDQAEEKRYVLIGHKFVLLCDDAQSLARECHCLIIDGSVLHR